MFTRCFFVAKGRPGPPMMQTQEVLELLGLSVTMSDPTIICSVHLPFVHS